MQEADLAGGKLTNLPSLNTVFSVCASAGFSWKKLEHLQLPPPYIPRVISSFDTNYFDDFANGNEDTLHNFFAG